MHMSEHRHETHPEIVKRLKRAEGHLKSIIAMIEDGAPASILHNSFMPSKRRSPTPSAR